MIAFFRSLLAELTSPKPTQFRRSALSDRRKNQPARPQPQPATFGRRERTAVNRPKR